MISSNILSKSSKSNITTLLAKHPILPPPIMPGSLPSEPPIVLDVDSVLGCIQSFPKGMSYGRDRLRAQHILDALCGEGSAIAVGLLKAISVVVNLLLERRCPKVLAEFVASAPLTPLLKPDNGIRPIAVGAIWRRFASKVAMRGVRKEMSKYLGDFQFGVGVLSGAEAFSKGDPFVPLLFALVLHPLVHRIRDCCQLLFHAWYLDYGTIIGDTKEPSCNGEKVKDGLFPRDIRRPKLGVKLLGGEVSRDAGFISSLAVKRASRAVELMSLLPSLRDPQSEILLLRSCMDVAKLLFGLRTCQPMYIGEVVSIFDNGLRRAIEAIVVCGGPFFRDFQWRLESLTILFSGLGLCSTEDVSTYAFVASRAQSWRFEIVKSLGVIFDLSPHQKAVSLAQFAARFVWILLLEGRSTLLPADILVFGWAGRKHACVDLTGVSPLVGVRDNGFVAGQAALKAESSKVAKHEKACLEN
ncbi:hypothetical protein Tco_0686483 [Tanacetum coccineum]